MKYEEFELIGTDPEVIYGEDKSKKVRFRVQVSKSPAGEVIEGEPAEFDSKQMMDALKPLKRNDATWKEAIIAGVLLGEALFPAKVHSLLRESLSRLEANRKGLRLRLKLEGTLNNLPWEFVLLNRGEGEATQMDFLGLRKDVSIVRHKAAPLPPPPVSATLPARLLVAAANPEDTAGLKLDKEIERIEDIVSGNPYIELTVKSPAVAGSWLDDVEQAHLFHFIGHGTFEKVMSVQPGKVQGQGELLFQNVYGEQAPVDAHALAVQLRAKGVRAAVLGACVTAERDSVSEWSNVAEALLKADLGAVVGMQFAVRDTSAVAFSKAFYPAIVAGLSIDEAVVAGRLAIASLNDARGWGTPVLYLRSEDGVIFPEHAANTELQQLREQLTQEIDKLSDRDIGVSIGTLTGGDVEVEQESNEGHEGRPKTGVDIEIMGGGSVKVKQKFKKADKDNTAVEIDTLNI